MDPYRMETRQQTHLSRLGQLGVNNKVVADLLLADGRQIMAHASPATRQAPPALMYKNRSMRKVIAPGDRSKRLMRSVSGLGMEDPVFGTNEAGPIHPSHIFEDMSISDVPEDMRDLVTIASDPTANSHEGLDMVNFHQSLSDFPSLLLPQHPQDTCYYNYIGEQKSVETSGSSSTQATSVEGEEAKEESATPQKKKKKAVRTKTSPKQPQQQQPAVRMHRRSSTGSDTRSRGRTMRVPPASASAGKGYTGSVTPGGSLSLALEDIAETAGAGAEIDPIPATVEAEQQTRRKKPKKQFARRLSQSYHGPDNSQRSRSSYASGNTLLADAAVTLQERQIGDQALIEAALNQSQSALSRNPDLKAKSAHLPPVRRRRSNDDGPPPGGRRSAPPRTRSGTAQSPPTARKAALFRSKANQNNIQLNGGGTNHSTSSARSRRQVADDRKPPVRKSSQGGSSSPGHKPTGGMAAFLRSRITKAGVPTPDIVPSDSKVETTTPTATDTNPHPQTPSRRRGVLRSKSHQQPSQESLKVDPPLKGSGGNKQRTLPSIATIFPDSVDLSRSGRSKNRRNHEAVNTTTHSTGRAERRRSSLYPSFSPETTTATPATSVPTKGADSSNPRRQPSSAALSASSESEYGLSAANADGLFDTDSLVLMKKTGVAKDQDATNPSSSPSHQYSDVLHTTAPTSSLWRNKGGTRRNA